MIHYATLKNIKNIENHFDWLEYVASVLWDFTRNLFAVMAILMPTVFKYTHVTSV